MLQISVPSEESIPEAHRTRRAPRRHALHCNHRGGQFNAASCSRIAAIFASASAFLARSLSTTAAGADCTKRSFESLRSTLLINNSRDALGIALLYLGYSVNTTDEAEIQEAYQLIADAVKNGVYQGKVMDEVFQKMEGGNAAIATYYAGDYLSMLENNEDLAYVVPEEGSNWFVDAMCVLKTSQHKEEAEAWINFMASTEANLRNMDYIWYASPNAEALETYPAYYEETYGEPLDPALYEIMAPSQEVLDRCEAYLVLPAETRTLYNDLWTQLGI